MPLFSKLLILAIFLPFFYLTTFLYGKGAYDALLAEQAIYYGNFDNFIQHLQSSYPLKSEMRINLAHIVLGIIRSNPEIVANLQFNALFLFTLNELEKEHKTNLSAHIFLVQYYAFLRDKENTVRHLNIALRLSPQRQSVLEMVPMVERYFNGR